MSASERSSSLSRRRFLAASTAAGLGATSGCLQRVRSLFNRSSLSTLSVSILAPPNDDDRIATEIATEVRANLEAVGIDASIEYLPPVELSREVLINGDYEMFVWKLPADRRPIALRERFYSIYAEESGWQNPYSFTDITCDELLDSQTRVTGDDRPHAVEAVVRHVVREQPFVTIGSLQSIRGVREAEFVGWDRYGGRSPLTYVGLETAPGHPSDEALRVAITDSRITRNLNPIAVEYRDGSPFLGLVYEPLVYDTADVTIPWLAGSVDWTTGPTTEALVTLRPDMVWHDGRDLTAEDVAFTYRFLDDTSMGEGGVAVPAPRYRGRVNLVDSVEVDSPETVRLTFDDVARETAIAALTVPILPEHIWIERTEEASVSGFDAVTGTTEALVWENDEPVGSGPLAFADSSSGTSLDLVRNEMHFLHDRTIGDLDDHLRSGLAFGRLELRTFPSDTSSVEALASGTVNATAATLHPGAVPDIGTAQAVGLTVEDGSMPYHLGFNTSQGPFSNPHFRRLVAQLVDKQYLVDEIFGGYGRPLSNPLDGTRWTPDEVRHDGTDPEVPFIGTEGEVDVDAAREAFREQGGFNFNQDGELVRR